MWIETTLSLACLHLEPINVLERVNYDQESIKLDFLDVGWNVECGIKEILSVVTILNDQSGNWIKNKPINNKG